MFWETVDGVEEELWSCSRDMSGLARRVAAGTAPGRTAAVMRILSLNDPVVLSSIDHSLFQHLDGWCCNNTEVIAMHFLHSRGLREWYKTVQHRTEQYVEEMGENHVVRVPGAWCWAAAPKFFL